MPIQDGSVVAPLFSSRPTGDAPVVGESSGFAARKNAPKPLETQEKQISESRPGATSGGRMDDEHEPTIVEKAEALVQDWRRGRFSKSELIGRLIGVFDLFGNNPDQEVRKSAYRSIVADVNQESKLEKKATERGQRISDAQHDHEDANGSDDEAVHFQESRRSNLFKRARGIVRERDDEDEFDEDDIESLSPGKRAKLERDQLPWAAEDDRASLDTNPGGLKNRELLRLFSLNPSLVVADIRNSATAPSGFPSSEWNNIIRGNAVNLDNVRSYMHLVNPPKESVGRLGDREITFGEAKPTKCVEGPADWHSTWISTTRAYVFVFRHRQAELEAYGEHILQLFHSKVSTSYPKVLMYDRAVRNLVGGGQRLSLTDFRSFDYLREAILSFDGVEAQSRSGGGNPSRGQSGKSARRENICDRFNRKPGCSIPDGQCKYKHVCRGCGEGGHGQATCEGGRSEKS